MTQIMYKVRDIETGLYKNRKGLWPHWDEVGTLFLTKSAAKCSVSFAKTPESYEIFECEVTVRAIGRELYPPKKKGKK